MFVAAGSDATSGASSIVLWSALLVVIVIVSFVFILQLKKRLMQDDEPQRGTGFTLADLRELQRSGQMSPEEFEKAKSKIVASAQAPPPQPGQREERGKRAGPASR